MKIFDSHFHIIDPAYPLYANQGYLPKPFTLKDYLKSHKNQDLHGGAIVSGSFQKFDQTYLVDTLNQLGNQFVGVTQLQASTSDEVILDLLGKRVRAVRFNLKRGGSESLKNLNLFAQRIWELAGWHVEFYVDSRELNGIAAQLDQLPKYSIDHLGLSKEGFPALLKLVEKGARIKATGFSRTDLDIPNALQQIHSINPQALMFGTDMPSTRAPRPYSEKEDYQLILDHFDEKAQEDILFQNASRFYLDK